VGRAQLDGELVCRRLFKQGTVVKLQADISGDAPDPAADIVASDGAPIEIWGVVTTVIKSLMS
jgi:hypothetical protein